MRLAETCGLRMVGPERFERPTPSFVAKCSIQLSYGPMLSVSIYITTKILRMDRGLLVEDLKLHCTI